MWIFLSESFLSIVEDKFNPGFLSVRARAKGDIEHVFPGSLVRQTPARDYVYRASIHNGVVGERIAREIRQIKYPNFKDSVRDGLRHGAYFDVWNRMHAFQAARAQADGVAVKRRARRGRVQL